MYNFLTDSVAERKTFPLLFSNLSNSFVTYALQWLVDHERHPVSKSKAVFQAGAQSLSTLSGRIDSIPPCLAYRDRTCTW